MARALDRWWEELGGPDPFFVVEAGAGTGALAAAVVGAGPACAAALRYVLVERSGPMRERQSGRLPLEPARQVLGPPAAGDDDDDLPGPARGTGPVMTSLAELPASPLVGVVMANELLDNLPFRLLQRTGDAEGPPGGGDRQRLVGGSWAEVRVDAELAEVLVPASPEIAAEADRLVPEAAVGCRIPLQHEAARWLQRALACLRRGRVVVVDYADTTPALARRPAHEWLRTYRGHGRGGPPLADLGRQDITCEVAVDQLAQVRPLSSDTTQAAFLAAHGIGELEGAARRSWEAQAAVGDLAALRARSRLAEAAALTDPAGLGGFRVLEWAVG